MVGQLGYKLEPNVSAVGLQSFEYRAIHVEEVV